MAKIKVFISYKTDDDRDARAEKLREILQGGGFEVFLDQFGIPAGLPWNQSLLRNIHDSDVLIVLLTPNVADSEWVKREIAFALGANVAILPALAENLANGQQILSELGLANVQWIDITRIGLERENQKLFAQLRDTAQITRRQQADIYGKLTRKWNDRAVFDEPDPTYATYAYQINGSPHPCQIHIAAGDIIKMPGIDVIVNSENTYMQMARFFEGKTVSAKIRRAGARARGDRIYEDIIQSELNAQISTANGIPVEITDVLVTGAGHPQSILRQRNHARYIFHVASIKADFEGLTKVRDGSRIEECVENCLERIKTLPDEPVHSIIFPLLGTGTGGLDLPGAVQAMLRAVKYFLTTHADTRLEHIYISAYFMDDVQQVEALLDGMDDLTRLPQFQG